MSPLILFQDAHLLAVHKPSGLNTHKPDRYAPDGIHEWLQSRHGPLAVLHRLDKDTSGVLVFGKSRPANQSLTQQFTAHTVAKTYRLLTAARPPQPVFRVRAEAAETEFELLEVQGRCFLIEARPVTGKTHQIGRHAATHGFPILGDTAYDGPAAARLMLHAHRIGFEHPLTGGRVSIEAACPAAFADPGDPLVAAREFRELLFGGTGAVEPGLKTGSRSPGGQPLWTQPPPPRSGGGTGPVAPTDAFRFIAGAADGFPDVVVDSYAGKLFVQWQRELTGRARAGFCERLGAPVVAEQVVTKQKRTKPVGGSGERLAVRENGLTFLVGFGEGYSTGLFLDQRENRRRLLTMDLAGRSVLNCFAYTCAFSVVAARAGARTTSVDLSRHYLEWGQANFRANGLDPAGHEFARVDVFLWLRGAAKRGRRWDVVLLDPPTFATTKAGRVFQAERDYRKLVEAARPVVAPGGWLFCSTNQRSIRPDRFEAMLRETIRAPAAVEFATLPFDFRLAPGERPYLTTFWVRLAA